MSSKIVHGPPFYPMEEIDGKSIGQYFFDMSNRFSDNIFQIDPYSEKTETFASVKQRSIRTAIEMKNRGITSKDVIVFCSANTMDNVIPVIATAFLGAKIASLDPTLSSRNINHLLNLAQPAMVFVQEESVGLIEKSFPSELSAEIVVIGNSSKYSTLLDFSKPKQEEQSFKPEVVDNLEEPAFLVFSSGTTGLPKAICLSHKNILFSLQGGLSDNPLKSILYFTTLYWISAIFMLLANFFKGGQRVILKEFDPEMTYKVIEKYKVDCMIMGSNVAYQLISNPNLKGYDLSSMKNFFVGGSAISGNAIKKIKTILTDANICQAYGLTEAGLVTMFDAKTDQKLMDLKPNSCGKVSHGVAIKVVDPDTKKILGPNEKGEICVKSKKVMVGYYKQDASDQFDEDGFLRTGDIGYYDEDECFYIVERIKEMFKYHSWHIVPSSIEAVILEHPAISEAVVFGMPGSEEEGHIPAACVVLKKNMYTTPEEIQDFVASKVLDRERLRAGVKIVDYIPKTPTGKFLRRQTRDSVIKAM